MALKSTYPLLLALLILPTLVAQSTDSLHKDKPDSVTTNALQAFKAKLLNATTRHLSLLLGADGSVNSLKGKTADGQEAFTLYLMFEFTGEQRFRKAALSLAAQTLKDMRATKFGAPPIKEKGKPLSPAAQRPEPSPHPELGQHWIPADVDWANPVYQTTFDDATELKNWKLECGQRMSIERGKFILESADRDNHLVCWLQKEAPADFLLEFKVRPQNRKEGLNIAFFSARGINGESVFDPKLKPRSGLYPQYNRSDLNAYHISEVNITPP